MFTCSCVCLGVLVRRLPEPEPGCAVRDPPERRHPPEDGDGGVPQLHQLVQAPEPERESRGGDATRGARQEPLPDPLPHDVIEGVRGVRRAVVRAHQRGEGGALLLHRHRR